MRVIKYPWHTAHDYELLKVPVRFVLLHEGHRRWNHAHRPFPGDVDSVYDLQNGEADILILHVDQWLLDEIDKRSLFCRLRDQFDGKVIVINHGCNMVDGCSSKEMQDFIGCLPTVCNSITAHELWNLDNSRYIRHGMDPAEWFPTNYARNNIVVNQPFSGAHQVYRNNSSAIEFEVRYNTTIDWIGRDFRFDDFWLYREFLSKSSIFFSPSYASPNPRARTEAMLSGLVVVTTNSHGESEYIENGVTGYASNDMEELYEVLIEYQQNPENVRKMGRRGREVASEYFHIARFTERWLELFDEVNRP